jgi:hypothetical protein
MVEAPYPPSPIIKNITWDPPEKIIRLAIGKPTGGKPPKTHDGSDNWPLTWADDDNLYTAYGDGYGFDPILDEKLSMGFGKVTGNPPDIKGYNIRSDGESIGGGRKAEKASGMLMVDGVLYLLARNADHDGHFTRLARSTDYARHWEWAEWLFKDFGAVTFINYGQNYAGAPGGYVYLVSTDGNSAYEPVDRFVLLRVPKTRLMEPEAYEYFTGEDNGRPVWGDKGTRNGIFQHPAKCLRSGISYNAGLQRYLWWQQLPHDGDYADTRYEGGFGVYDAPDPWGPWTTVYFTEKWDTGPGETGSFPPKWMFNDGKECWLVFSGNDAFSLRKAVLNI